MKPNEINLIDRKALRQLRELHPELSQLELVQILVKELKESLRELQQEADEQKAPTLQKYATLRPDERQIKRAMQRVLHETDSNGRYLIATPRHWLSLMRVLQFLGICPDGYGHCQHFTDYVNRLFADGKPRVACCANYIVKGEATSPFNKPLSAWEHQLKSSKERRYWELAALFLSCLEKGKSITESITD